MKAPKLKFIDYSTNAEEFNLKSYLRSCIPDPVLLETKEGRVATTYNNPLLFALIYFPEKIKLEDSFSFADFHLEVSRWAATEWTKKPNSEVDPRDAFICPRGMGKSTWLLDILVMWAACHGHQKFVALFADTPTQAEQHLSNFRETAKNNELLRADYPRVCGDGTHFRKTKTGEPYIQEADRNNFFRSYSGFTYTARGIGTAIVGLKVGDDRPSLILCDDILKGTTTPTQSSERLDKFIKSITPLPQAGGRIVVIGTSFAPGDMIHDLKRAYEDPENAKKWVTGLKVTPHYYPPFITREDGSKRSCWAARWSYEKLQELQKIDPAFPAAFLNEPVPDDGSYWKSSDFMYGDMGTPGNFRFLSIDPATTVSRKSDYTAIAVVAYSNAKDTFQVEYSTQVKMQGTALRSKLINLITVYNINQVMIETNQGGELWTNDMGILHDVPVKIHPVHFSAGESKETRAEWALTEYNRKKVFHLAKFQDLETQMMAFPVVQNDDLVDSVTNVIYTVRKQQRKEATTSGPVLQSTSYVRGR